MSLEIRLTVFEIAISPEPDIKFHHSKFVSKHLDDYYRLNVLENSFGYCKSEL